MSKYTMPPRQKMINLLYVILIAMLAINVSSDVLGGYKLMNRDFDGRIAKLRAYNRALSENAPSDSVRMVSGDAAKLCLMLENLREDIARHADRDKYRRGKLKAIDDLNAVPDVMLSVVSGNGRKLREALKAYCNKAAGLVTNPVQKDYIMSCLPLKAHTIGMSWEKEAFSYLPAVGGITYLNQLEEQVLLIANEVYKALPGGQAVESVVAGKPLRPGQRYVLINDGQRVVNADGTVDGPVVQVAQVSSETLYRNYENTLSIFCAGVPMSSLRVSMSNGRIIRNGNSFKAVPGSGGSATVQVSYVKNGQSRLLAKYSYVVKSLPVPAAYLAMGGSQYRGSVPVSKHSLLRVSHIGLSVDDGPKVNFRVQSFETVLIKKDGTISTVHASGASFSGRQRSQIESMEHGDRFYVTSIMVSGPGGRTQVAPIEVVVI